MYNMVSKTDVRVRVLIDAMEAATISPRSLAKQLHLGNTTLLERRIRKELEDVGKFLITFYIWACSLVKILLHLAVLLKLNSLLIDFI